MTDIEHLAETFKRLKAHVILDMMERLSAVPETEVISTVNAAVALAARESVPLPMLKAHMQRLREMRSIGDAIQEINSKRGQK